MQAETRASLVRAYVYACDWAARRGGIPSQLIIITLRRLTNSRAKLQLQFSRLQLSSFPGPIPSLSDLNCEEEKKKKKRLD